MCLAFIHVSAKNKNIFEFCLVQPSPNSTDDPTLENLLSNAPGLKSFTTFSSVFPYTVLTAIVIVCAVTFPLQIAMIVMGKFSD